MCSISRPLPLFWAIFFLVILAIIFPCLCISYRTNKDKQPMYFKRGKVRNGIVIANSVSDLQYMSEQPRKNFSSKANNKNKIDNRIACSPFNYV